MDKAQESMDLKQAKDMTNLYGRPGYKPTKTQIFDRLTDLRSYYSTRNQFFDLDDKYYELLFLDNLGLPEEYKDDGIVLPTARDIVEAGTNHVSTVYARFFRPVRGSTQEAADQAEMLRKFDTGLFYRTKMESNISPWRVAAKHGCLYGMWCFESVYDESKVPDEPEQQDGESDEDFQRRMDTYNGELQDCIPISIRAIHPRCVYPEISENPKYVIIEEPKTLIQARKDWPMWTPAVAPTQGVLMGSVAQMVNQVTYWDEHYRAVYLNLVPVTSNKTKGKSPTDLAREMIPLLPSEDGVVEHDYGFCPYTVGYSGLGNLDWYSHPERKAVGLIRYLKGLLRSESFAYSVYNVIMKNQSWPITFVSGPGSAALSTIKMKYGKIYEKPPGTTIEDYIKAPPPEFVMQSLEYTNSKLSDSAAPKSVRGLAETNVRSGSDRSQVISEASLKYDTILEQMQLSTAKVMSNCTKIAERVVPDNIYLWAKTPDEQFDVELDKSKIKGHYTTYVEFTPVSPEEEARRHADGMNLVKSGILSSSTMRQRYLTHIDSQAEDIKVEAERLRNDPNVVQVLAQIVAQNLQAEATRLGKIKQLQAGNNPFEQQQTPGQPQPSGQPQVQSQPQVQPNPMQQGGAPSGPGGAQMMSAMLRQRAMQGGQGIIPNSPEAMRLALAQRSQGGRITGRQGTMPNMPYGVQPK